MKTHNWADPQEVKELMCGNKMIVTACWQMGCSGHCELVAIVGQ